MQSKEILDGNKLIAEFCGLMHIPLDDEFPYDSWRWKTDAVEPINKNIRTGIIYEVEYHISWDWLMPVGKKISDIFEEKVKSKDYMIDGGELFLSRILDEVCYFNIEKLWVAIVEYIEWYNINESQQA